MQSFPQHPLSKAEVAAPTVPVDNSSPTLGIKDFTENVQNIADELMVEVSNMTDNEDKASRQKTSNSEIFEAIKFQESAKINTSLESICELFFEKSLESTSFPDLCDGRNLMKLKGGSRKEKEALNVKKFTSETEEINLVSNLLRSSSMFESLNEKHKKCAVSQFCNFCLLRSSIYRINLEKGRKAIKPVELECQSFNNGNQSYIEVLKNVLESSMESYSLFTNEIVPKWECTCCTNVLKSNNGEFIIQLDHQTTDREINNLVEMNYNRLSMKVILI